MAQFPQTHCVGLETWMSSQIANLTTILTAPEAGILLVDSQITDLKDRSAAGHDRIHSEPVRRTGTLRAAF